MQPNTSAATHEEIEQQILIELRQIHALLAKQQRVPEQAPAAPATQRATVSISGQSIGSKDAPVTLVEFADYNVHFASSSRPLSSIVLKRITSTLARFDLSAATFRSTFTRMR